MRAIKFRGKAHGRWIYGGLVYSDNIEPAIYFEVGNKVYKRIDWAYVDPATIGQFTGLKDRNGRDIYDGDIIKEDNLVHKILWVEEASAFCRCNLEDVDIRYRISRDAMSYVEVIGNIHDNPELLEEGGDK